MIKQQKKDLINKLKPLFQDTNLYIIEPQNLNAHHAYALRKAFYDNQVQCKHIPNALLARLLNQKTQPETLKRPSLVLFAPENPTRPAKVIETFLKENKDININLKFVYVYEETYEGKIDLKTITQLQSKEDLIAQILTTLQSPMTTLLQALQSNQQKLLSILTERAEQKENKS